MTHAQPDTTSPAEGSPQVVAKPDGQAAHPACGQLSRHRPISRNRLMLGGLVTLAALQFIFRAILRGYRNSNDLAAIYGPARAWTRGDNPYDPQHVTDALLEAGYHAPLGGNTILGNLDILKGVYPPFSYLCVSPLTLLDWPAAKLAWLLLNLAMIPAIIAMLVYLYRSAQKAGPATQAMARPLPNSGPRATLWYDHGTVILAISLMVLLLSPIHTGMNLGQLALASTTLTLAAFLASLHQRPLLAGVLAGVAMAVKPQVGIVAVAYLIARFRLRSAVIALITLGLLFALGALQLQLNIPDWVAHYRANLDHYNVGGYGDMTRDGPLWHQLISVHVILHAFTDNHRGVAVLAVTFGAAVTLLAMGYMDRHSSVRKELLFISILATACLLTAPGHRFYDAALLVLPLTWALLSLGNWLRRGPVRQRITRWTEVKPFAPAGAALIAALAFTLPGAVALHVAQRQELLPESLVRSALWDVIILPHQPWALCVILGCLLWGLSQHGLRPMQQRGVAAMAPERINPAGAR